MVRWYYDVLFTKMLQLKEVYELLNGHYVEDEEAMFRLNYCASFLDWCVFPVFA